VSVANLGALKKNQDQRQRTGVYRSTQAVLLRASPKEELPRGTLPETMPMLCTTKMPNKARTNRRSTIYLIEDLQGDSVKELELHWRESKAAGRAIQISLSDTEKIDDAGHTLLSHMFSQGAELIVGRPRGSGAPEDEEGWLEIAVTG